MQRIDDLGESGALDRYYLFHAVRADLLRRFDRDKAAAAYQRAASLATNPVGVDFLKRRLRELGASESSL